VETCAEAVVDELVIWATAILHFTCSTYLLNQVPEEVCILGVLTAVRRDSSPTRFGASSRAVNWQQPPPPPLRALEVETSAIAVAHNLASGPKQFSTSAAAHFGAYTCLYIHGLESWA
jgi:hypothetical protein